MELRGPTHCYPTRDQGLAWANEVSTLIAHVFFFALPVRAVPFSATVPIYKALLCLDRLYWLHWHQVASQAASTLRSWFWLRVLWRNKMCFRGSCASVFFELHSNGESTASERSVFSNIRNVVWSSNVAGPRDQSDSLARTQAPPQTRHGC